MLWTVFLIGDLGCNGAMFVGRIGSSGPEALTEPFRWTHRNRKGWDRHGKEVEDHYRFLLDEYRPTVVAFEKPFGTKHRRHVGVSQGYFVGRAAIIAEMAPCKPTIVQVPGQHGAARDQAWAIMRPSFAEIMESEAVRALSDNGEGRPGEHVTDACANFLAAIPRWEELKKA